jgi:Cu2+-containing amine oxidase
VKSAYFIGNYIYEEELVFHQDGSIDVHVNATGTTLNPGVDSTAEGNRNGKTVTANIAAPNHQHFISFRIDFDVDGLDNRVVDRTSCRRQARPATHSSLRRRRSSRSSSGTLTARRIGAG